MIKKSQTLKISLVFLVTFLSSNLSFSQDIKKWTLKECVDYAHEKNLTIKEFELNLENAKIDHSDALGNFIPTLNARSSFTANSGLATDPTTNELKNQTLFSVSPSINSSLTLFDGLQNFKKLNRAKLNEMASFYQLESIKDDIDLSIANAYLQILSNKEALTMLEAQLIVTQKNIDRTNSLIENGALPQGDILEIEATYATQEQQIVNAQNALTISKITLAQLLTLTDYANFDVATEAFEIPQSDILDLSAKEIYNTAHTYRNNIRVSQTNLMLAEKDLEIAKGKLSPTLSAFFNYNTRYASNIPLAFDNQFRTFDGVTYGMQLDIPIFNKFTVKNNIIRNRINIDKTQIQLEKEQLNLEININQVYVDLLGAKKAYEATQKTVAARKLAYDYSRERFEVGLTNSFNLSQAQLQFINSEAELVRTKYEYIFKIKMLELYAGKTLGE